MTQSADKAEIEAPPPLNTAETNICPVCRAKTENIPINNDELLYMCTITSCSYPFLHEDELRIRSKISVEDSEQVELPNNKAEVKADKQSAPAEMSVTEGCKLFDIHAFLEEQAQWQSTDSLAGVIDEIIQAAGTPAAFNLEDMCSGSIHFSCFGGI